MIFEKLADGITKHAKLVLIIWVVVLLASAYPALHASESLSYSTSSMGGSSSESIEGAQIISDHFESSTDSSVTAMILVTYDSGVSSTVVDKVTSAVTGIAAGYEKISSIIQAGTYGSGDLKMILFAVTYDPSQSSSDIQNDTANLRNTTRAAVNDAAGSEHFTTYITGSPAISYDASVNLSQDISRVDPLSILMILILVGLFFRSFVSSAAPPITIGVAFALVMCALFFLGQVLEIYYITEILLLVSMLGAGCDYCIFILSRYREERRSGKEHIEACRQAIMWAGESVTTSGIAVMIGFGAMMICSFRLISYMGLGLAIGIVFALLAALTLMSSLLVLLGDKLFWPTGAHGEKLQKGYLKKMGHVAEVYFKKSTHFSIKHAKAIIVATILFTVPMVYVYATAHNSYDMIGSMMSGESQEGMVIMTEQGLGGSAMPNYAVFELTDSIATVTYIGTKDEGIGMLKWTSDTTYLDSVKTFCTDTVQDVLYDKDGNARENIGSAYFSSMDVDISTSQFKGGIGTTWSTYAEAIKSTGLVSDDTDIVVALELLKLDSRVPSTAQAMITIAESMFTEDVRNAITAMGGNCYYNGPMATAIMDWALFVKTGCAGVTYNAETNTSTVDYLSLTMATKEQAMSDNSINSVDEFKDIVHDEANKHACVSTAWVSGTAAVMVEISEMMGTEFLKIELTAIILIIILLFFVMKSYLTPIRSVVTIFMSVIWTVAITHLLFTNVLNDGVLWMLPIILLVICLGLGMDYDILLTTRIREYRFDKGMSNDEAIENAVLHSGSVITICGLIMGGTFGTLMLSNTVMLQQMGFALCFAILVDALIVRTYIVPAAMHLMGEWNWKGPAFLHKKKAADDEFQQQ